MTTAVEAHEVARSCHFGDDALVDALLVSRVIKLAHSE
jgi:hypothetical protein